MKELLRHLSPLRFAPLLLLTVPQALAGPISVPPAPNPASYMGFEVRRLMDKAGLGLFDPIVIGIRQTNAPAPQCPQGYADQTSSTQNAGASVLNQTPSAQGVVVCADPASTSSGFWSDFQQWLGIVLVGVLGQFSGDDLARFVGGQKDRLYLSELLRGLCNAWRTDRDLVVALMQSEYSQNLLGDTLCNLSDTYQSFLEVLRVAYLYGDRAIDNFYQGVIRKFIQAIVRPMIREAKVGIVTAYNSLPFAKPLYDATEAVKKTAAELAAQFSDLVLSNALRRSSPYVDSTVAWLLGEGYTAWNELESGGGGFSGLGVRENTGDPSAPSAPPPDRLAMVMAASSPRVLQELQTVGEKQASLMAQKNNFITEVTKEAKDRAESVRTSLPEAPRLDAGAGIAEVSKQQTNERELLISLIELSNVMGQESLKSSARLEAAIISLVEEGAKTNAILSREATKELDEQIRALEEIKQQLLQGIMDYASMVASTTTVMDNVAYLIGSLGVDRAGIILTEEQFQRLQGGGEIPVP